MLYRRSYRGGFHRFAIRGDERPQKTTNMMFDVLWRLFKEIHRKTATNICQELGVGIC